MNLLPLLVVWAVAVACGWEDEWADLFWLVKRPARWVARKWSAANRALDHLTRNW